MTKKEVAVQAQTRGIRILKLSDWISAYPAGCRVSGPADVEVTSVVSHSKEVTPGALFVGINGDRSQTIAHIAEAFERGARVIVTDALISLSVYATGVYVKDAIDALAHLAHFVHGAPGLRLTGITGTNGKTTTTWILRSILSHAGFKTGLLGTVEYDLLGKKKLPATHTTPGPLELAQYFAEMRKNGATDAVMEVSSHALDQRRTEGLTFETALFTNLTQDHLDYHKTMWDYFGAKRRLFGQAKNAVINIDNLWGQKLKEQVPTGLGFGIDRHDAVYPRSIKQCEAGTRMEVETPIGLIDVISPLLGRHNVYNLLSAIAVATTLAVPAEAIAAGIAAMPQVPGRMERIDCGQDFSVIVDYAHTDAALAHLLETVASFCTKRVITVFGCGGDRDRGKRLGMGIAAAERSGWAILTSDNPRSEAPDAILAEVEAGVIAVAQKQGWATPHHEVIPDRRQAIFQAIGMAQAGDVVVIAGKGHETVQIIGKKTRPFDDRAVAREALGVARSGNR